MIGDAINTSNAPRDTILHEGDLSSQDLMQDMVHDAFRSNGNNVFQEEVFRLKLELQAANQHSNDLEKEIKCATQRFEDRDKRVMGALNYIFKNIPGSVPFEFVDLINSHVWLDCSWLILLQRT
ncbi:uncharacterized protein G2W53_026207 [Senna tora]|uniref:Uncharacterized protein n=1 Tax=Senna tora TaxID=362788 RepID=A0A834TEM3_9FABA|nr:uncharacterized protein G2W53_026207 [Senna tora]